MSFSVFVVVVLFVFCFVLLLFVFAVFCFNRGKSNAKVTYDFLVYNL